MIGVGPTFEVQDKMRMVRQLSDQIVDAWNTAYRACNERGHPTFTPEQAVNLQQLQQRRAELLATLPRLQIIAGTTRQTQEKAA